MKTLGTPTTLGELRLLLELYPDETLFQFRNQPVQELIEVDGDICFQETNRWDNIRIANIGKGIIGNGFAMAIFRMEEARTVCIAHDHVVTYPKLPGMKEAWGEADDADRYLRCLKATLSIGEYRKQYLNDAEIPTAPVLPFDRESLSLELTIPKEAWDSQKKAMLRATESIEKLAIAYHCSELNDHKKHKGHERPYKFHR